jgi:hypothetical protein
MHRESVVQICLVDMAGKSLRVSNVVVDTVILFNGNERYKFTAGVTNSSGICTASFRTFERQRIANQRLSLMDYNTTLEECDDAVLLLIPSKDEMRRRATAARIWSVWRGIGLHLRALRSRNGRVLSNDLKVELAKGITKVSLPCRFLMV